MMPKYLDLRRVFHPSPLRAGCKIRLNRCVLGVQHILTPIHHRCVLGVQHVLTQYTRFKPQFIACFCFFRYRQSGFRGFFVGWQASQPYNHTLAWTTPLPLPWLEPHLYLYLDLNHTFTYTFTWTTPSPIPWLEPHLYLYLDLNHAFIHWLEPCAHTFSSVLNILTWFYLRPFQANLIKDIPFAAVSHTNDK